MFSVNIDKLINMTANEAACYSDTVDELLSKCDEQCRTIGVVGNPVSAFKLASAFAEHGRKILFVEADIANNVFLSKYRLGKDLKGFTDYITGDVAVNSLVCLTNKDDVNIMFTGEVDELGEISEYAEKIVCLLAEALNTYDLVIVLSGKDGEVASYCGGTVAIVKDSEYSEDAADELAEKLEDKGCYVLGVIIDEQ